MSHVCPHKMASGKGTTQTDFAGKNGSSHDSSELPGILARICWVGPSDAEEVEHSALRFQDGPASNRADFDRRHGDTNLKVVVITRGLATQRNEGGDVILLSHHGNAVTTFDILRRILTGGEENRSDDVGRVRVETPDTTSHGTPN